MRILFEDESLVVVDKPAGQYMHPSPGHETGTLSGEFVRCFPASAAVGSVERPGIVHRLDADTSGVVVLAKAQGAYLELRRQFESHREVKKLYLAVCHGRLPSGQGRIDEPVGREHLSALTRWTVLARRGGVSLVEFAIETGRMHQIRIHASRLGCPIAGDPLYGDRTLDGRMRPIPRRTLLHSVSLSFIHPVSGKRVEFSAPPPADIVHSVS